MKHTTLALLFALLFLGSALPAAKAKPAQPAVALPAEVTLRTPLKPLNPPKMGWWSSRKAIRAKEGVAQPAGADDGGSIRAVRLLRLLTFPVAKGKVVADKGTTLYACELHFYGKDPLRYTAGALAPVEKLALAYAEREGLEVNGWRPDGGVTFAPGTSIIQAIDTDTMMAGMGVTVLWEVLSLNDPKPVSPEQIRASFANIKYGPQWLRYRQPGKKKVVVTKFFYQ